MGHEVLDIRDFRHQSPPGPGDAGLARLARVQGGMVSVAQLRAAGLDGDAVRRRAAAGILHHEGRGAYAFGYPRRDDAARAWRAVLMYDQAALSRTAAAWAHGVRAQLGRVHLSSLTRRRSGPIAQVHRVAHLEVVVVDGLPVTPLAQTFLDVAATEPPDVLAKMLQRSEELRTFDLAAILPLLHDQRGSPALREALAVHRAGDACTRSELERRFRTLVLDARIQEPLWNVFVEGLWVDAFWPHRGVVAELDGGQHRTVSAQDRDTRRNAALTAAGYIPLRFTWAQVTGDRAHVLRTLRALL